MPQKRTDTLTGIFTNNVVDTVAHAYALAGLRPENAISLFRRSINETQQAQKDRLGAVDQAEMRKILFKPALLLPEHYSVPRFGNLISAISIPPELVEQLSLMERQKVEVKVNPQAYTPEKGLEAFAVRKSGSPEWAVLDR